MLTNKQLAYKIRGNVKVTSTGCWKWQKGTMGNGYGSIAIGEQKQEYTHRVSYRVFNGPIPMDKVVMHTCDNPICCNPSHLVVGTSSNNSVDMMQKGRGKGQLTSANTKGERNPKAKLNADQVIAIRSDNRSNRQIADAYGVTDVLIGMIKRRKVWKHV